MKDKSQAFIDFLMTYGWIIMVFLMAIAALDYFRVIDLTSVFPEKCVFDYKMACVSYKIKETETELAISNEVKMPVTIDSIDAAGCSSDFSTFLPSGETSSFTIKGCKNGKKGSLVKGDIILKYTEKRSGLQRTVHGKIKSKVRE